MAASPEGGAQSDVSRRATARVRPRAGTARGAGQSRGGSHADYAGPGGGGQRDSCPESVAGETSAGTAARIATPARGRRMQQAAARRIGVSGQGPEQRWGGGRGRRAARGPTPLTLYRNLRRSGSAVVALSCRPRAARDGTDRLPFRFVPSPFRDEYASVTSGYTIGPRDRFLDYASVPLVFRPHSASGPLATGGTESHGSRVFARAKRGKSTLMGPSAGRGASMGLPAELLSVTNRPEMTGGVAVVRVSGHSTNADWMISAATSNVRFLKRNCSWPKRCS